MKKLTLTFCALFALLVVAPALYADDGPERMSGKDKEIMQPAPPVCDFYRAHEWNLSIWGSFMFSANPGDNHASRSDDEESDDEEAGDNFDPFTPDRDPFVHTVITPGGGNTFSETRQDNPNERVLLFRKTKDTLMGRDNTWGGGVDAKYFWSKYFGFGVEGIFIAAKTNFAGAELGTLTVRYPWGRFAPYGWGGIGFLEGGAGLGHYFNEKHKFDSAGNVIGITNPGEGGPNGGNEREFWTDDPIYNHNVRGIGQLGVGMEFRLSCHIGIMADFSWNFVFGRNEDDSHPVITENGNQVQIHVNNNTGVTTVNSTPVVNTAVDLVPGQNSDRQDFGMARVGVTFAY
jgi:hypothetical protein